MRDVDELMGEQLTDRERRETESRHARLVPTRFTRVPLLLLSGCFAFPLPSSFSSNARTHLSSPNTLVPRPSPSPSSTLPRAQTARRLV